MFFSRPKIEVFVRHCHFSAVSSHKKRFSGYSPKRCFDNLLNTFDCKKANLTFFLDTFHPMESPHFLTEQNAFPVISIQEGTESGSFLRLLEHVSQLKLKPDTIVYFLEDDYLHRAGWLDILQEGFTLPQVDYVTLYDHRDKYSPLYEDLEAKLFHTASCHWRTTPSTTNTYAMRFKTLQKHLDIHRAFSLNGAISADHQKFCALKEKGALLVSPIPGWSTHAEPDFASPCVDWERMLTT
jgi:hypothetical protein